jgi:SAM-dependent methyltransferase
MSTRVFHDQKRSRTYREDDESAVLTDRHQRLNNVLRDLSSSFGHDISVLDLGCGTGRYFHCVSNARRLTGIDISLHMLKEARNPVRREQITCKHIDLICGDISELAIAHESFDFIYSIGVFIRPSSFGPLMCDQLFNLVKPGGRIFITLADGVSPTGRGVYTQLSEVIEQSRFIRPEISYFGDVSTPPQFRFYGCTAIKAARRSGDECMNRFSTVSNGDGQSGDMVWRNVNLITPQILTLVPVEDTFILVDQDVFRNELVIERRVLPFTERDGQYWGPPADDISAIQELERLRRSGANFMVFAWPAFWWLDHYSGLNRYLRSKFQCRLESELVVVFDLRT